TKVTTNRSSLLVDPPDGRVPPLTAEAQRRAAEEWKQPIYRGGGANAPRTARSPPPPAEARRRAAEEWKQPIYRGGGANGRGADWATDRSLFERCITRGLPGAMSPSAYNNNYRVLQRPGYV